jgi:predicted TIM-barrel fold metal-dependent hydrolase
MMKAELSPHGRALRFDCHIHLVGNGWKGSGCWLKLSGWHRMMGGLMAKMVGLPISFLHEDFDEIYVTRIVEMLRTSSLDHALLLAQDEVYNEDGSKRPFGSFHVPNEYLFSICEEYPEFIPAVSIHPARRDALDELDCCLERGARALKLLPNCLDVHCSLPRFDSFWEKMAAAGLPLLAHTGGEMTVPVANPLYQDPEFLRRPLEIGVKVIAAHAASGSALVDRDYFDHLLKMMAEFPQLYADTSALNTPFRSAVFRRILACGLPDRFVHGSDYPVPVGAWYTRARGLIDGKTRATAARIGNPLERDFFLKQAIGFDEGHFTRLGGILRKI